MAFAMEQPDMEVLLFFIIPIKIKWMAILDAVIFGITIVFDILCLFFQEMYGTACMQQGFLAPSAISVLCQRNGGACVNAEFHNILLPVQERPCKEQYTEKLRQSNENSKESTAERQKRLLAAE
ncbi:MAG: hypothetical protein ACLRMX_13275 [Lachnospira eligens]